MNRIFFLVHYNKYDNVSNYIFYLLKNMRNCFNRIVFVSNSLIDDKNHELLMPLCNKIILRKNIGFDFGAWKDALLEEGWEQLVDYDSITLMNDSCFGPLFDIKPIYKKMETANIDFWGLTNYRKTKHGMPQTNTSIPEHIQSYFLCFNKDVVNSHAFRKFWDDLKYLNNIEKVIRIYETQLTTILHNAGFKYSVSFDTTGIQDVKYPDITGYPDIIVKNKIPMLKIKSFISSPLRGYIIDYLKENSQYPTSLITDHFDKMFMPNINLLLYNKSILVHTKSNPNNYSLLKIAVHIHVYRVDMLKIYLSYLNNFHFKYDVFITTNSKISKEKINILLNNVLTNVQLEKIFIVENKEGDIIPWMNISGHLNKYNIVGYFNAKSYTGELFWITLQQELFDHLLSPIDLIINTFNENNDIGIIIPEIPMYLKEFNNYEIFNFLWKKLKCKKDISFDKLLTPIMPYGNMFWYRPNALKQFFSLNSLPDFMGTPLANESIIVQCLERLVVYIAWENGFDFRIITANNSYYNCFSFDMVFNRSLKEIVQSKTHQSGEVVLYLPKLLKRFMDLDIIRNWMTEGGKR